MRIKRFYFNNITHQWMRFFTLFLLFLPVCISLGLVWKSLPILQANALTELLLSSEWKPMSRIFGFAAFIVSSLWVTLLALLIAAPVCILSAIHLTQYAPRRVVKAMQPVVDILAGIPSVVYGVWGVLNIVPWVSHTLAPALGYQTSGYNILSASIVLAVMIIPFILNILIEIFRNIPIELQETSLALGANRWYSIKYVLMRKAFPGIISALGLGLSRAFGETMAVMMVAGNVSRMPTGAFQPGYPLPALIANNYGEMMTIPLYDSALMLAALILFLIVLAFNMVSRLLILHYEKISQ